MRLKREGKEFLSLALTRTIQLVLLAAKHVLLVLEVCGLSLLKPTLLARFRPIASTGGDQMRHHTDHGISRIESEIGQLQRYCNNEAAFGFTPALRHASSVLAPEIRLLGCWKMSSGTGRSHRRFQSAAFKKGLCKTVPFRCERSRARVRLLGIRLALRLVAYFPQSGSNTC